jgi:NAD(P)-dependent dehydrogenase (short-subunit alcohol dehydrogenase family)
LPLASTQLKSSELFSVSGKTVVLTGASGFLGRTFARALLTNGARLVALGRSERLLREGEAWAKEYGEANASVHQVDMYDITALTETLSRIAEQETSIDVLVNNAHELGPATGFNVPQGSLDDASFDSWMRNLTGGVYWAALTTQKLGVKMKQQGAGSIINISTMYALVAPRPQLYQDTNFVNPPAYSASKAALLSFTRYVASFWGQYGIRANAILPGPFSNTQDIEAKNSVQLDSPFLERLKGFTCVGRIGQPHELVGALLLLASDASSYMTGQGIVVDGGWTAV